MASTTVELSTATLEGLTQLVADWREHALALQQMADLARERREKTLTSSHDWKSWDSWDRSPGFLLLRRLPMGIDAWFSRLPPGRGFTRTTQPHTPTGLTPPPQT